MQVVKTIQTNSEILSSDLLDQYIGAAPSPQVALDIFAAEWSSKLPDSFGLSAGTIPLFEDTRISWAASQFDGFLNKRILELGPLEAGHTYMIEQLGAAAITAVEANIRAYLKCLVIKEVLGMKTANFLLGDITEHLKQQTNQYDICIASGVLYHMKNPAELIHLLSKTAKQVFIWTHYHDADSINSKPHIAARFSTANLVDYEGFRYAAHRQEYGDALGYAGFCGGSRPFSIWMEKSDILNCLKFFGFHTINIAFDTLDHSHGPSFGIAASRI